MNEKLFDYLFEDEETDEVFLVEAISLEDAKSIANDYFENPHFCRKMSVEEGEYLGLDTY